VAGWTDCSIREAALRVLGRRPPSAGARNRYRRGNESTVEEGFALLLPGFGLSGQPPTAGDHLAAKRGAGPNAGRPTKEDFRASIPELRRVGEKRSASEENSLYMNSC